MNRRSLLALTASAAAIAVGPATAQQRGDFIAYESAGFARLLASGAPIVVHVHADWCPTCRAQDPTLRLMMRDPALANVRFVRVNFDRDRDFLTEHRVASQSTILIFRERRVVARMIGTTNPDELNQGIRRAVA